MPAAAQPPPGGAERAGSLYRLNCHTFAAVPCPAGALSPPLARTAGSQCASPNGWSDHSQAVRYPRRLCHLARTDHSLTCPRWPLGSLSSDRFASPSGASWPLFFAAPRFLSSSALFAFHPSVSAISREWGAPFCMAFTYQLRI